MRLRAIITLGFTSLALVLAGPVSAAVAYPATTCPTLSVSTTTPLPGETITVTGAKFAPNASIRRTAQLDHRPRDRDL